MHELSIALSILEIVGSTCRAQGLSRVESVRVRVGRATGILREALLLSFDAAKADSAASEAALVVEEVPLGGRCLECAGEFTSEEKYVLACPLCGGASFKIESGHELEVVDLEVQE